MKVMISLMLHNYDKFFDKNDNDKYLFAGFIASCAMVIALAWSIS